MWVDASSRRAVGKHSTAAPAAPRLSDDHSGHMGAMDAIFNGADPQEKLSKAAEEIDTDIEDNDGDPPFGE